MEGKAKENGGGKGQEIKDPSWDQAKLEHAGDSSYGSTFTWWYGLG